MNGSLRRGVPPVSERSAPLCFSCRKNRHRECDLHMNDGAVDAEEFVSVCCKCPCEGEVPAGGALIDLVARLREQIGVVEQGSTEVDAVVNEEVRALRSLVTLTENFICNGINDEGAFDTDFLHSLEERYSEFRMGIYQVDEEWDDGE